ncbi:hypothetical protein LXA43DRAFT_717962 [Ganoderma leucocontextum]|nr:hypothetical protein LXA43DRAFT_717962 [Ganoderma leucocontextum]
MRDSDRIWNRGGSNVDWAGGERLSCEAVGLAPYRSAFCSSPLHARPLAARNAGSFSPYNCLIRSTHPQAQPVSPSEPDFFASFARSAKSARLGRRAYIPGTCTDRLSNKRLSALPYAPSRSAVLASPDRGIEGTRSEEASVGGGACADSLVLWTQYRRVKDHGGSIARIGRAKYDSVRSCPRMREALGRSAPKRWHDNGTITPVLLAVTIIPSLPLAPVACHLA